MDIVALGYGLFCLGGEERILGVGFLGLLDLITVYIVWGLPKPCFTIVFYM